MSSLFWLAIALVVIGQVLILRSTVRALRRAPASHAGVIEWTYAIVPVIALAATLAFTWLASHDYQTHREMEARARQTGPA